MLAHHSRTFSSAIAEQGRIDVTDELMEELAIYSTWLACRLDQAGLKFRNNPTKFGEYIRDRVKWSSDDRNNGWYTVAVRNLQSIIHDCQTEYSLYEKSVIHGSEYRCVGRYGRSIKARYASGA